MPVLAYSGYLLVESLVLKKNAVFQQMKEGKMKLTFGFSEIMTNAIPEVIHETFNKRNLKLQMENRPKVGIGVIIIKDNIIPLCKRKNTHGAGS